MYGKAVQARMSYSYCGVKIIFGCLRIPDHSYQWNQCKIQNSQNMHVRSQLARHPRVRKARRRWRCMLGTPQLEVGHFVGLYC